MSCLAYAADKLSNIVMNTEASMRRILGADCARKTADLGRTQLIQQAAMAM